MKKQSLKKLQLRKDVVAHIGKDNMAYLLGGGVSTPKCAPIPNSENQTECLAYATLHTTDTFQDCF